MNTDTKVTTFSACITLVRCLVYLDKIGKIDTNVVRLLIETNAFLGTF